MKRLMAALAACLVLTVALAVAAPSALAADPANRQTALGKYVTAVEALAMWEANKDKVVIVDCRTAASYFYVGHTPMALNVPLRFWTGKWDPEKNNYRFNRNKNFVPTVEALVGRDKTILMLSKAGIYGALAVNALAEAGFTDVYNITDGFDGWKKAKLPVTRKLDPDLVYQKPTQ